jgi:hypothetical protein
MPHYGAAEYIENIGDVIDNHLKAIGDVVDDPEGTYTVEISVTLAKEWAAECHKIAAELDACTGSAVPSDKALGGTG